MPSLVTGAFALTALAAAFVHVTVPAAGASPSLIARAHAQREAATDLAISGDLQSLPSGTTRYLSREDLLTLPQSTFTVRDDPNFTGPTEVSGVLLEDLVHALARDPDSALVVAICDDRYHAHYPRRYLADHHPLLVLRINGQPPDRWPKDSEGHGNDMGPYLISHRQFTPALKILAHVEERQIPWGVIGLEFRAEKSFFAAIAPRRNASNPSVEAGFRIAQQTCLRCHNMGDVGGDKAQHPWLVLSAWAASEPAHFAAYVRNPQSVNPRAQMPANPDFDADTLDALIAYFQTFQSPEKP